MIVSWTTSASEQPPNTAHLSARRRDRAGLLDGLT
jgi:hypothetical protein